MEVSSQVNAPAILPPLKVPPPLSFVYEVSVVLVQQILNVFQNNISQNVVQEFKNDDGGLSRMEISLA
jgi:hypothetical protein